MRSRSLLRTFHKQGREISTVPTLFPSFVSSETFMFPTPLPVLFGLTKTTGEVVPNSNREMNFNLTERDNYPLGAFLWATDMC